MFVIFEFKTRRIGVLVREFPGMGPWIGELHFSRAAADGVERLSLPLTELREIKISQEEEPQPGTAYYSAWKHY